MPGEWRYQDQNGRELGPFSSEQVRKLAAHGAIAPATPVQRKSGDEISPWRRAGEIVSLFPGDITKAMGGPICGQCGAKLTGEICTKCLTDSTETVFAIGPWDAMEASIDTEKPKASPTAKAEAPPPPVLPVVSAAPLGNRQARLRRLLAALRALTHALVAGALVWGGWIIAQGVSGESSAGLWTAIASGAAVAGLGVLGWLWSMVVIGGIEVMLDTVDELRRRG